MFKRINIEGWRQFRKIDVNFHPRLTILTGASGAGKTTLLSLASRHFGWGTNYVSTPKGRGLEAKINYSSDFWMYEEELKSENDNPDVIVVATIQSTRELGPRTKIGEIEYSNGATSSISVPTDNVSHVYDVQIDSQQGVEGLHIPSHRPTSTYQQVQNIPTVPRRRHDVFQNYLNLIRTRLLGGHTQWSPQYYMKETLIALATFGYGNTAVEADLESATIFEDFQEVLRRMLPPKLGFKKLVVRVPEVILETETGPFSIDALSGGAAAVIDLAWQIFMYQPSGNQFVVTLDEPENHLHPELQRRVLRDLLAAFPNVQFIVATHSPFIVGSVPNSYVYVLDYDESHKVRSTLLDTVNKAGSANEILRDVLGIEYTMPIWVEDEIEKVVEKYSTQDFNGNTLAELRKEMDDLGLGKHVPMTIARLAAQKDSS